MIDYQLSILEVVESTVVDGPGIRIAIYSAGCEHHCPGCHNPESWDMAGGKRVSVDRIMEIICQDPFSDVTFSGGDPLFQPEGFTELARRIKFETGKNIWCYTGYRFEQVRQSVRLSRILPFIDVLVDGPFVESLKDESLFFRGSSNQRLINVAASLDKGRTVEYDYRPFPRMAV